MAALADLERIGWELAIAAAREGKPDELAALLRKFNPPDQEARGAIADLIANPVARVRPSKARFTPDQAEQIRKAFGLLTQDVPGDPAVPTDPVTFRAMSADLASDLIGRSFNVSPDTVRDILERKKTYKTR